MSIFRTATTQAIREIVEDNGTKGRFGLLVTEENLENIATKIVDLFEMTLSLRNRSQDMFAPPPAPEPRPTMTSRAPLRKSIVSEEGAFPRTKNAAEIYDMPKSYLHSVQDRVQLPPTIDFKLPRRRMDISLEEREKMAK